MTALHLQDTINHLPHGLTASVSDGFDLRIELLNETLMRIALVPRKGLDVDRTWMIAPGGEVAWDGRDRLSTDGFECPGVQARKDGFDGNTLCATVEAEPLRIAVKQKVGDHWVPIFEDRPGGAYQWFNKGHRLKHFQCLRQSDAHYGLGDKTGPVDRTGRRVRVLQSDALGFDAEHSDPLYKHAPWIIVSGPDSAAGLLYDTMAEVSFDLGAEHSNYFPRYRHAEIHEEGLVLYVMAGPRVGDVVPRLHDLTGYSAFPPRWAFGFAFTTMHHADAPNAQEVIMDFAHEARGRDLPISAIHLGSGYTRGADGLRYVFNWDLNRFPHRDNFFSSLRSLGFRTSANVKPVLLTGHSAFQNAWQQGWFVRRAGGEAAVEMFWGGEGASLDFTNRATIGFWQTGVSQQVLGAGFDAVWNDNNEAELWDETATLDGFGKPLPGMECRPVHALLMTRASFEIIKLMRPDERPYTITRAGPIGIARYGETWSGDNRTSWHSLKWNLRQGLSMSLSGMPLVGHDIGGFDGPPPDDELLVRWFQMMALHPRCVMNSWKADYGNIPNLPWMHENVFDHVKSALRLRYVFLPYLYGLVHKAHRTGEPVIAPTFFHFDHHRCRDDCDAFMLGPDVLVAPVVEPEAQSVTLFLPPSESGWLDYNTGQVHAGGQDLVGDVPLGQLPVFVRGGAVLPLAQKWPHHSPHDASHVALYVFPGMGSGQSVANIFFDDGLSWNYQEGKASQLACALDWDANAAHLSVHETGNAWFQPVLSSRCASHHSLQTDWRGVRPESEI